MTSSCAPPVGFVRAVELCLAGLASAAAAELLRAPLGPWCAAATPYFWLRAVGVRRHNLTSGTYLSGRTKKKGQKWSLL
jgi:hypothetical protein